MYIEIILAIIIIRHLQNTLQPEKVKQQWNTQLVILLLASITLLVIDIASDNTRDITTWIGHGILFYLIYIIFSNPVFRSVKPVVYTVLPYIVVIALSSLVKLINFNFYTKWDDYFDTAELFALIWIAAMWFINRRQRKALEKERLKTQEKERENKITESLKAGLEIQVAERTAALTRQKEELQLALDELKSTQNQLIQSEKMASLGELTAGIAHEIQNPLNFVNNFSELNTELIEEMKAGLKAGDMEEVLEILGDIAANEEKINLHGKRADAIVKGMLHHSRNSSGIKEPTAINALADEYLRLAYHGLRAKDKSFNATMITSFDETIGNIAVIPQDIGRVILNLITNAFYAVAEKKKQTGQAYEPTVWLNTKKRNGKISIEVKDNGNGIPQKVVDKIFQPFFTTKPTGQGTGLGLSMSYDIVTKGHSGELKVQTNEGEGATFTVILPT